MSRIPTLIFSSFVLSLLGTNAWADGMVHSAPAPCCETASFAGAYIGGAVGYARQRVEIDNLSLAGILTFNDSDSSVTFGGYVGYNFQRCCSPFVFGIETDFNYLDTSPTALDIEPPGPGGLPETTSLESNIDWFGTLRGRAGYVVHDNLLLYATGGLAYASVDHTLSDDCVGSVVIRPSPIWAHFRSPTIKQRLVGRSAAARNSCTTPTGSFAPRRCMSTLGARHIPIQLQTPRGGPFCDRG